MSKIKNNNPETKIISVKETVLQNLKSKDIGSLKLILNNASELDLFNIIHGLSAENQALVYRLLSKDKALFVFEQLDAADQEKLMRSFTEETAIEIISELEPDDRVRLLDELPATVAQKMLAALSPEEREATNLLMGYEAHSAGRIMTPEFVRLQKDLSVVEAAEKIKSTEKEKETIYNLYVTDDERRLEGVISLRELFFADAQDRIETIMQTNPAKVSTDDDQEEAARLLQKLDLLSIPVVDKENRIVGIITVDDAMDIIEDETTEDIYNQAGLVDVSGTEFDRSDVLVNGSLFNIWKVRLPFLAITLVAGVLAGFVIGGFEELLMSTAAVAIFIPLIMDMGGNIGTQSSTVFARGVVVGHIDVKKFMRHFLKETGVGLSIGVMVGVISGIIAAVWQGEPLLGIAVGLALVCTISLAALLGFLVPYVLIKLNVDQAAGAAPIITSIKDISGLLIYFILVSIFMGHLL
jgi:magnesium transporter